MALGNPKELHKDAGDAYKTLFVGRLVCMLSLVWIKTTVLTFVSYFIRHLAQSFETDEKSIRREFENYGPVKTVTMIKDHNGKQRSRGKR